MRRKLSGYRTLLTCLVMMVLSGCSHDPEKTVTLKISGISSDSERETILESLKTLTDGTSHFMTSSSSGGVLTVDLSPVADVEAFAKKVTFGRVESVTGREVSIRIEPVAGFDIRDMEEAAQQVIENDGGPGAGANEAVPAPAAEIQ